MKQYVFIADDDQVPEFGDMCQVAKSQGFETPFDYSRIDSRSRGDLLLKAQSLANEGNHVCLITDALFLFESHAQLGGARLGEDFLKMGGADPRVVIRSSQPLLTDSMKCNPRVLAVKRPYPLNELFTFLKTGRTPKTPECLEFLWHVNAISHLFSVSESDPAVGVAMVIEALSRGFGSRVPEPFDSSTLDLFASSVAGVLGQGFHRDDWKRIVEAFHPYDALESAASDHFSPGKPPGNFVVLWFVCLTRSRPSLVLTELQKSENRFGPREQEWIRRRRRALEARVRAEYSERTASERWGQLLAGVREELNSIHSLLADRDEVG